MAHCFIKDQGGDANFNNNVFFTCNRNNMWIKDKGATFGINRV